MRPWTIAAHLPEAGDRYDRLNEATLRLELQRTLAILPGELDARYLTVGAAEDTYLPLAGGVMTGEITLLLNNALRGHDGTASRTLIRTLDTPSNHVSVGSSALPLRLIGTTKFVADGDLEFEQGQRGVITRSGDGTRWRIRVLNTGAVTTDNLGP